MTNMINNSSVKLKDKLSVCVCVCVCVEQMSDFTIKINSFFVFFKNLISRKRMTNLAKLHILYYIQLKHKQNISHLLQEV